MVVLFVALGCEREGGIEGEGEGEVCWGKGDWILTISEKAIVAPTVPAPTIATLAVVGLGIFAGFGVVLI